eukprot:Awhi_evm1s202
MHLYNLLACLQDSPNCDSINTTHCSLKDYYKRCQFCSLGYTLDEQGDCEVCPGFVSNCTKVDYANSCECSECQSGHKLNDSKECILCSSISSPDCDSIDPGTCTEINDSYWSKCSICNAGFKLDVNSDTCQGKVIFRFENRHIIHSSLLLSHLLLIDKTVYHNKIWQTNWNQGKE